MKEQLLLLHKLQEIDSRTQEIQKSIDALPAKLAPAKSDLTKLEALLAAERQKIAETEKWKTEQEDLVQRESEALKHAKAKLQATKSAKEFAAATREVDNKKRSIHEREQEAFKLYAALDESRAQLEAREADVAKLREHVAAEEAKQQAVIAELAAEAEAVAKDRPTIAVKVDPALLERYEYVRKMRGVAVVPIRDGACMGCHMTVAPQLINIIARFESIESCARCSRLLFRPELLEDGPQREADQTE